MTDAPRPDAPASTTGAGLAAVRRVYLLAEREFTAYVATLTFWIALALGPISMVILLGVSAMASLPHPHPADEGQIAVQADDPELKAAGIDAVRALTQLNGHPTASARLVLARKQGQLILDLQPSDAMTPLDRAFVLDRVALQSAMASKAQRRIGPPAALDVSRAEPTPARPAAVPPRTGRVAVATLLWLTLTGSLGMLLQAVVRERANRGLESLLSVASPLEIVLGKLAGVGAVASLVMGTWIGTGAGLAALAAQRGGLVAAILGGLSQPADIAKAGACFVLAYLAYGLTTVAIGSTAGDTAAAQNMSRPLFAVLMVVFLAVTASAGGDHGPLDWLVYLPPFTPFLLITGDYSWWQQACAVGLYLAATLAAGVAAKRTTRLRS